MTQSIVLATDYRAIGLTIAAVVVIGFIAMFVRNIAKAKSELGSEIELAPNKKPYLTDEELEGTKLDRSLGFALGMLVLLALALPLYWLAEPGRQDGAVEAFGARFEAEGERSYSENCSSCHSAGGTGGAASYVLQDADGGFIANATWSAPRLNNVLLRYSEDEVRYILNFGRPGSPMAAWGTPGGGPLTSQQIDTIIAYLNSVQVQSLDPVEIAAADGDTENILDDPASIEAQAAADVLSAEIREEVQRSINAGEFDTVGEAVFNLGLESSFHAGSLSCGRCHTAGWSLGTTTVPDILAPGVAGCGGGDPSGIGFNLCGGSVKDRFPDDTWKLPPLNVIQQRQPDLVDLVTPSDAQSDFVDTNDDMWAPLAGLNDDEGEFILSAEGDIIRLDDKGLPLTDSGETYIILDDETNAGNLAECSYISKLWQPETGEAYPFDPDVELVELEDGGFEDPEELTLTSPGISDEAVQLANNRIVDDCTIAEMPERTSQAHYEFIYNGADAGVGYGRGGQSAAGLMPGFGSTLPPELIQAVVDYERGL